MGRAVIPDGGPVLLRQWCNVYGMETGGAARILGGLTDPKGQRVTQWMCQRLSIGRFRMVCFHGHQGQIMPLCSAHWQQYKSGVSFCPRCNIPPNDHRCALTLVTVS